VLTGILRVAKESIFSGLNNLAVYSILRPEFATAFGFTEAEVEALAELAGPPAAIDRIREWYDGYRFGGQTLYNPWSVISFLDSADREFRPYWIATSSNDLVRELLSTGPQGLRAELEALLGGGTIDKLHRRAQSCCATSSQPRCGVELPAVLGVPARPRALHRCS
jgi:hypothetical protein